jgi:hypothetical protein
MLSVRAASTLLIAMCLVVAGCGDDGSDASDADVGPNPTPAVDPGPNPTTFDPGPNDTSRGPRTIQGTVALDAASDCVALETDSDRFDLRFTEYSLDEQSGDEALVDDSGTAIAHTGDAMIVTGLPSGDATSCGRVWDVDSLVNVTPAA